MPKNSTLASQQNALKKALTLHSHQHHLTIFDVYDANRDNPNDLDEIWVRPSRIYNAVDD